MLKIAVTTALLLAGTACTQLPRPEFQAYRDSFQAAHVAADPLIAEYAVAERADALREIQRDPRRTYARDGYFSDLQLTDAAAISPLAQPPGADGLIRIYRGIELYNETLLALAENRNIDVARTQLQQLSTEITAIVPGLQTAQPAIAAGANLLLTFLGPAIAADNRERFREIVLAGYPLVRDLIDVLRTHAQPQFATRIAGLLRRLDTERNDVQRARLIKEINDWHTVYANYVALLDVMKARLGDLNAAVANPRSAPVLERAVQGAAEVRAYADALRLSIAQIHALQ